MHEAQSADGVGVGQLLIEERNLPNILRKRSGEFSGRVNIAKQHIGNGITGLGTSKPHVQDRGDILVFPF